MSASPSTSKLVAGFRAAMEVQSGAHVGFGTGSTSKVFTAATGWRIQEGQIRDITGIATSDATLRQCQDLKIPMVPAADIAKEIDKLTFTCDGADKISLTGYVIKGGGGAHNIEKLVARSCVRNGGRYEIIVDKDKISPEEKLGTNFDLPVEVDVYAVHRVKAELEQRKYTIKKVTIRESKSGEPFVTDRGNLLLDVELRYFHPDFVKDIKKDIVGVIDTGLFDEKVRPTGIFVGNEDGTVVRYKWDLESASFVVDGEPEEVKVPGTLKV